MQLVGGDGISEGRVEYCIDNLWISVCSNGWDHYDAQVVCRQLGFSEYILTAMAIPKHIRPLQMTIRFLVTCPHKILLLAALIILIAHAQNYCNHTAGHMVLPSLEFQAYM